MNIVTASVGKYYFGFPVENVEDVIRMAEITPVPLSPAPVLGVMYFHGHLLTVISLARCLSIESSASVKPLLIVTRHKSFFYGFPVDAVQDTRSMEEEDVLSIPAEVRRDWGPAVTGAFGQRELVFKVDPGAVLENL